jgi:hypothetical protein
MSIEIREYTLPSHWACPLINGDESGLNDSEIEEITTFLETIPGFYCTGVSEESDFRYSNDANNMGGDCYVFTFLKNS